MILFVIISAIILFFVLKEKLNLITSKSIFKMVWITLLIAFIYFLNVLYNWNYFKQYDGLKSEEYYFAYSVLNFIGYTLLVILTVLSCSIISTLSIFKKK